MQKGITFFVIALCGLHLGNGATRRANLKVDDSKIYFPEEFTQLSSRYGEEEIPEECRGQNYCTVRPADYPQEKYNKLFNGTKTLQSPQLVIEPVVTIGDKIGDDATDDCDVKITFEPLYHVRSKRGDWHKVIQAPEQNYLQKVRIETCTKADAACFQGIGYGPEIETGCVQKHSVWEFVVDDGKGGMETIQSELPICCSCHYKVNFANRIGSRK